MVKLCRKLHNWLGLLLIAQILCWFGSGLVMSVMPISNVRGEHLRQVPTADWQHATISPQQVLQWHPGASLSLSQRIDSKGNAEPVYLLSESSGSYRYSAVSGQALNALSHAQIQHALLAQYRGKGQLLTLQLLQQAPQEAQNLSTPLWQAQFDDTDNSRFYLDPNTGSVLRVRTDGWRVFDFVWMLHIMDYQNRSNFNNPLLISFTILALLFTLSGIVLLWQRFRPRRQLRSSP